MTESMRMWIEVIFNTLYLITIWGLVIAMLRREPGLPEAHRPLRRLLTWAFVLLAFGDTGHVGFRILAYLQGDLSTTVSLLGHSVGLVGLGSFFTAYTVTIFYMLVLLMWKTRFKRQLGAFGWFLLASGVARLVIMAFPQNQWSSLVPPFGWSMARNIPLMIQGLGAAVLILQDAVRTDDRVFHDIAICILASYAFYIPVILFVQVAPLVGMLMIPKTLAYVAIAIIGYRSLFLAPTFRPADASPKS